MTELECAPADDLLAKRYQAIVASSGGLPNHLQDKSALFRRLKAGLKALVIPPPCSFSYRGTKWWRVILGSSLLTSLALGRKLRAMACHRCS